MVSNSATAMMTKKKMLLNREWVKARKCPISGAMTTIANDIKPLKRVGKTSIINRQQKPA